MKRILVTGASRGIGRSIAVRLAAEGRTLYLHGRDTTALAETAVLVKSRKASAETLSAELSNVTEIQTLVEQVGAAPLDVLVNNAGVAFVNPIEQLTPEQWRTTLDINVSAPFFLIQRLMPSMRRGSAIVNILSIAAHNGFPTWSSYCASKFALDGLSRALREELRPRGIRVITVTPSATNTTMWDSVTGEFPREKMLNPDEVAEAVAFALSRPMDVSVDSITVGNIAGTL